MQGRQTGGGGRKETSRAGLDVSDFAGIEAIWMGNRKERRKGGVIRGKGATLRGGKPIFSGNSFTRQGPGRNGRDSELKGGRGNVEELHLGRGCSLYRVRTGKGGVRETRYGVPAERREAVKKGVGRQPGSQWE